ncbi:unnamed protein product [Leptidea sinapis]|uniref:Acyltransferase 3 domain-containing protein n=1 Tax=Leptidea sinapis TaxID=189913 RepID=A0A5E4QCE5_9NEOP|nr:unnamed protein product [Leptidea sinapis]
MPVLSELDDFDLCLRDPDAVYCIVDMELLEDDTPLYQYIKNFSSLYYKNYKHTKLHRGVCGSQHCGINFTHANVTELTVATLKECFNATIHQTYGLQVEKLSVRYCKTQVDRLPVDTLDIVVGIMLLMLLFVNIGSSAYYFFWPPLEKRANRYMLAFCIQKNWKALKYGGNADGGIFKCFQAMRFYTMVMILGLHSMIFIGYGYTENPDFIENSYNEFFKSLLFNARIIVQIFFVMGGFLMAYKMLVYAENHEFTLKTIPMAIVNRWLRYLGTDTQLFLITMVVLLIIWRWPRSGVPVLSLVMVVSLLIPFLQSYFMNLLPIRVSIFPESIRDIFGYNDTFYHAYVSAQGNWAGYHLGILQFLFIVSIPVAFGTVLMGWDLHHREASAFEAAIFNALNQNFFAFAMCIFIIGYFYKCNNNVVRWHCVLYFPPVPATPPFRRSTSMSAAEDLVQPSQN